MKTHTAHMTLVMDRMTEIMAVQHVFDDRVSQPDGGPLKYVLEVGQDRFAVFLSDRSGDMIVSPFEMVDFLEEAEEPIPVLRLGALSERTRSLAELGPAYW
jgi:hypothetical protein